MALPLQAFEHMYVVTEHMVGLPDPFPMIRHLNRGMSVKRDARKLVIGWFEPDAKCWNLYGTEGDRPFFEMAEDRDPFAPFMGAALELGVSTVRKTVEVLIEDDGKRHSLGGP
ncbi:MAG: hypothetical protein AAF141_14995 [Pseudomonadota bacterium]